MAYEPISKYVKDHARNLIFRKKGHREFIRDLSIIEQYAKLGDCEQTRWYKVNLDELRQKHPGAYEQILEEVNPGKYAIEREAEKKKAGILLPRLSELVSRCATRESEHTKQSQQKVYAIYLDNLESWWEKNGGLV